MRETGQGSQDRLPVILLFLGILGYFCISCQKPSSLVVSPGLIVSLDPVSAQNPQFFSENPVFSHGTCLNFMLPVFQLCMSLELNSRTLSGNISSYFTPGCCGSSTPFLHELQRNVPLHLLFHNMVGAVVCPFDGHHDYLVVLH